MAPPVTRVIFHIKPNNLTSWGHHGTNVWYIDPSLDHFRCMYCYMPRTGIVKITDTLQNILKSFALPKITTDYYLQQAIGYMIAIMKDPPKTPHSLLYGYETEKCDQSD